MNPERLFTVEELHVWTVCVWKILQVLKPVLADTYIRSVLLQKSVVLLWSQHPQFDSGQGPLLPPKFIIWLHYLGLSRVGAIRSLQKSFYKPAPITMSPVGWKTTQSVCVSHNYGCWRRDTKTLLWPEIFSYSCAVRAFLFILHPDKTTIIVCKCQKIVNNVQCDLQLFETEKAANRLNWLELWIDYLNRLIHLF